MKIIIVADESSLVTAKHNKEPLIKSCFNMFKEYWSIKDILVQCPVKIAEKIKKILPKAQIYTEPVKKGTAAAVGLAAIRIALQNPDEVVIVSYSDHPVKYRHKLHSALKVAQTLFNHWKKLILIGVNPTFPATDYGYAQIGKVLQEINGTIAFEMVGFKEKP
ncbi:MAG TPA: sugar phosphate nucleotidyltransferase, partial [Candidatus Dojkabacteria bacterium]|nr:sugar phosphate nucleotidyltransferase [Candidatus Dojkabacteria bacterium]